MKVNFENHTYELKNDAFLTGLGRGHYEAYAVDEEGKDCTIVWEILEDFNFENEDEACDWDNPNAVLYY